jgi:serine/threonine protein kinase
MTDRYSSKRKGVFSFDSTENRIETNFDLDNRNPYAANINPIYEMQKVTVDYKQTMPYYFTVMVNGAGERDLTGPIFKMGTDKSQNTTHLLNFWLDIARAGRNINAQGILHGDIKPDNMILKRSNGDYQVDFIDFDLIYNPKIDKNPNDQLRYSKGFRAPWIKPVPNMIGHDEQNKPVYEDLYTYDPKFTEDSFAIAISIKNIYEYNKKFIDQNDIRIVKILDYLKTQVIQEASSGFESVPTTQQVYDFINSVVENKNQDGDLMMDEPLKTKMMSTAQSGSNSDPRKMSSVNQVSKTEQKPKIDASAQTKDRSFPEKIVTGDLLQAQSQKDKKKYLIL